MPSPAAALRLGWELLPEVSRSFALVTRYLGDDPRSRLGDAVMVFYLVCRVLDTIEDSTLPAAEKSELYRRALAFLCGDAAEDPFARPEALTAHAGYRRLLGNAGAVRDALATLPEATRRIILRYAGEMAQGMESFGDRPIRTMGDLEAYCHPVAVVVGYGLTELFADAGHLPPPDAATMRRARSFGLTLQKVNVTRDFGQDAAEGRCFWPAEVLARHGLDAASAIPRRHEERALAALGEMIDAIAVDADAAMDYLLAIPASERRLRMFCGVSLFLALHTLARLRGNAEVFDPEAARRDSPSLKVARADFMELVARLEGRVGHDGALRDDYAAARRLAWGDAATRRP